jgi:hypothetical protein
LNSNAPAPQFVNAVEDDIQKKWDHGHDGRVMKIRDAGARQWVVVGTTAAETTWRSAEAVMEMGFNGLHDQEGACTGIPSIDGMLGTRWVFRFAARMNDDNEPAQLRCPSCHASKPRQITILSIKYFSTQGVFC